MANWLLSVQVKHKLGSCIHVLSTTDDCPGLHTSLAPGRSQLDEVRCLKLYTRYIGARQDTLMSTCIKANLSYRYHYTAHAAHVAVFLSSRVNSAQRVRGTSLASMPSRHCNSCMLTPPDGIYTHQYRARSLTDALETNGAYCNVQQRRNLVP